MRLRFALVAAALFPVVTVCTRLDNFRLLRSQAQQLSQLSLLEELGISDPANIEEDEDGETDLEADFSELAQRVARRVQVKNAPPQTKRAQLHEVVDSAVEPFKPDDPTDIFESIRKRLGPLGRPSGSSRTLNPEAHDLAPKASWGADLARAHTQLKKEGNALLAAIRDPIDQELDAAELTSEIESYRSQLKEKLTIKGDPAPEVPFKGGLTVFFKDGEGDNATKWGEGDKHVIALALKQQNKVGPLVCVCSISCAGSAGSLLGPVLGTSCCQCLNERISKVLPELQDPGMQLSLDLPDGPNSTTNAGRRIRALVNGLIAAGATFDMTKDNKTEPATTTAAPTTTAEPECPNCTDVVDANPPALGAVTTYLNSWCYNGSKILDVNGTKGFKIGRRVRIHPHKFETERHGKWASSEEIGTIAAFGSIYLDRALLYSHPPDTVVEQLPADGPEEEEEEEAEPAPTTTAPDPGPDRAAEYAALAAKLQAQADAAMEALRRAREQMAADREQSGEVSGGGDAADAPTGAATGAAEVTTEAPAPAEEEEEEEKIVEGPVAYLSCHELGAGNGLVPIPHAWEGATGGYCLCGIHKHLCEADKYCCANIGGCKHQKSFGQCLTEPVPVPVPVTEPPETEEEEEDGGAETAPETAPEEESEEEEEEAASPAEIPPHAPNATTGNGTGLISPPAPNATTGNGTGPIPIPPPAPVNATGTGTNSTGLGNLTNSFDMVCLHNKTKACLTTPECGAQGPCVPAGNVSKVCLLNKTMACLTTPECGAVGPCVPAGGKVCALDKELECQTTPECGAKGPCVSVDGVKKVCALNKTMACLTTPECGAVGPCVPAEKKVCLLNKTKACETTPECGAVGPCVPAQKKNCLLNTTKACETTPECGAVGPCVPAQKKNCLLDKNITCLTTPECGAVGPCVPAQKKNCLLDKNITCLTTPECGAVGPCVPADKKVCLLDKGKECQTTPECGAVGPCVPAQKKNCLLDKNITCLTTPECGAVGPCVPADKKVCLLDKAKECQTTPECGAVGPCVPAEKKVCLLNTAKECQTTPECGAVGPCVPAQKKVCLLDKTMACLTTPECGAVGPCVPAEKKVCLLDKAKECQTTPECGAVGPCVPASSGNKPAPEVLIRGVTEGRRPHQLVPNGTITHHNGHAFANFTAGDQTDKAAVANAKQLADKAEKKLETIARKNRRKRQELLANWMSKSDEDSQKQAQENVDVALGALNSANEMAGGSDETGSLLTSLGDGIRKAVAAEFSKGGQPLEQKIIADKLHKRAQLMDAYKDGEAQKLTLLGKNDAKHDAQLQQVADTAIAAAEEDTPDAPVLPVVWTVQDDTHQLEEDEDGDAADASGPEAALEELYASNVRAAAKLAAEAAKQRVSAREKIKSAVTGYVDTIATQDVPGGPTNSTPIGFMGR